MIPDKMDIDVNAEKLKGLQISSLDEELDEDEASNVAAEVEFSDEDDEEDIVHVTLGFAEKPKNQWSLLRQYFPSKAGGAPAWLDPVNLPSEKSSLCDFCGEPLQFLIQVYAPLPEESAFHRTLSVFMCTSMGCLLRDQHEQWKRHPEMQCRSVKVFRCQLLRVNSFYSSESPVDNGSQQPLTDGAMLCNWCGTWKGDKLCGSCRRTRYCSGKHQAAHWKSSKSSHKTHCRQLETSSESSKSDLQTAASNSLWPEYEIINEDESEFDDTMSSHEEPANQLISKAPLEESFKESQKYFEGQEDTRSLAAFQERLSLAPEQVLRYSRSPQAKPLWPLASGRPSKLDIPKCNNCGGPRCFEFQVLPQLLYFFHVKDDADSLDWSSIVVYTCEDSCGERDVGYKEEFAWVQIISQQ